MAEPPRVESKRLRAGQPPRNDHQAIVGAWPRRFESDLARRLGIVGDRSLPHLINRYIHAHLDPAHATRTAS